MSTTPQTFWGGSSAKDGKVRQLDVANFAELVDRYFDKPVCLPHTRAEWTAMTEDQQKAAKDCSFVCSCSFKPGTVQRNNGNADLLQSVNFDIDEADIARDFANAPRALEDALWPFSFVAYFTASSTPENPRIRITVPVEPCDPANHKLAAHFLCRRLGMPESWKGRRESFVLSQPFYRPVKLQGEDFNAIIASRTNGDVVELADLPPEIIEEVGKTYAYQADYGDEDCELESLLIPCLTVEDIREPLFAIDPDCDRQPWYEIAAGLKHQFREEEDAQDAYNLFVEWSSGGSKFIGEEDCYGRWKSFRPVAQGRRSITIHSLFHYAQQAGWINTKIAAKAQQSVEERIAACNDAAVLSREGMEWVATMEFKNAVSEEQMINALHSRLMQLGAPKVSTAAIKKAVNQERKAAKAENASSSRPAWLRPWCYISSIDRFYSTVTGMLLTTEAFNRTFGSEMMKQNEEAMANGRPLIQPADFALNTEGMITKVDLMVYDPRFGGENAFFKMPGEDRLFVNGYRADSVPKIDEKNSVKAGKGWFRLLKDQFAREEDVLYLTDWVAWMVQNPGKRIRHIPCIQGAQGSGKTLISKYVTAAIGPTNAKVVYPKDIDGKHNDWATGAVLVVLEEIYVNKKARRAEIMDCIKPLVTNDDTAIHEKYKNQVTVPNTVNYLAFTNHHDALYLEETDRRWWVIKSKIQSKDKVLRLNQKMVAGMPNFEYHGAVIKNGGALRHFFLNYEVRSSFDPNGPAPETPWRRQMVEASKNNLQREIESVIDDKVPLVGEDIVFLPALEQRLQGSQALRDNYPVSHYLYLLGFQPFKDGTRFGLNGSGKGEIWVNAENYIPAFGHPHEILMERYASIPDETIQ